MSAEKSPTAPICPICSCGDFRVLPFGYIFKGRVLRGVKCLGCELVFIHPQPSEEEIRSLYLQDYFTSQELDLRPHGRGDYFSSVESSREAALYISRLKLLAGYLAKGRLLEIGCGPGHFLRTAKEDGWDVTGIELSEFASRHARDMFKLQVITGTLKEAKLPEHSFDAVFMGDLLEHVPRPKDLLNNVCSLLKPSGLILIEIPSMLNGFYSIIGSLVLSKLKKVKYINLPPYHLIEFTPKNIGNLLSLSGFEVIFIKQGIVSPADIGLRESPFINALKKGIQSINFVFTKLFGICGDRLTIIAIPKSQFHNRELSN